MGSWVSLFLSAALVFQNVNAKTLSEHWADVGLKFSAIEDRFTTEACYQDQKHFIACIHGINGALSFHEPKVLLVATSRVKEEAGFGSPLEDFGLVQIIEPKKVESENFAEVMQAVRKEKALTAAAWDKIYAATDAKVDFEALIHWVKKSPSFPKAESEITGTMANGWIGAMRDPHTSYEPVAYVQESMTETSFEGIGAAIRLVPKNGKNLIVLEPLEGSPALKAGVRANDIVTHVDDESTDGWDLSKVVGKIKGPKGTTVKLSLVRNEAAEEVTITRDTIEQKNVEARILGTSPKIGYLKLDSFAKMNKEGAPTVYTELKAALKSVLVENPTGLVLDLRNNTGGFLSETIRVASLFLKKGTLVMSTKDLTSGKETYLRTADEPVTDLPLVVLINNASASASEIIAGCLQDHQRAFLVGEDSYGKATVQSQRSLGDILRVVSLYGAPKEFQDSLILGKQIHKKDSTDGLSEKLALRFTVQRFYLPSGRTNQITRVKPDTTVHRKPNPAPEDLVAFGEEDQYAALPPQGTPWVQPRPDVVKKLDDCLKTGKAEQTYKKEETNLIPPDYQRLVAEDAVGCIVDLKLWEPPVPRKGVVEFFYKRASGALDWLP